MNKHTLERLKPFIYGKLLGDGNLEKLSYGRRQSRLKLEHKIEHKEYILFCYKKLHNFSNKPFDRKRKLSYKGKVKTFHSSILQTKRLPAFTELLQLWYADKKRLPNDLHKYFTAELLAVWYMDDGYTHRKERSTDIVFCTDSFTKIEVEYLIQLINEKFDLNAVLYPNKSSYRIRIGYKDKVIKFKSIVEPYIIECMKYKLNICNKRTQRLQ